MKYCIIALSTSLLFAFRIHAQRIALVQKTLKQPIIYTDSLTVEQVKAGYFPIPVTSIDTFYASLKYLKDMLSKRQRAKMQSFELRSGETVIKVQRVPFAYGDRYAIVGESKVEEVTAAMALSDLSVSNKKNAESIGKFMKYIENNKSLFRSPYEIHPMIYNVVVVLEH